MLRKLGRIVHLIPGHSTQKILHHARMAEAGVLERDSLKESVSLELDMINILYVRQHAAVLFLTSAC